jgi:NAD(P)H-hydrate epimerase
VVVADIGLLGGDPSLMIAEEEDCPRPPRPRSAHKWSAGSVLVVGGSQGMLGAAVLAGRAALHFGAGAVGVAVPDGERASVAVLAPELLNFGFEQLPDRFQVLVIGPGLGSDHGHLVDRLLAEHRGPVVLDADGLRSFTDRRRPQTVLTPHAGEFRRLASRDPSPASAAELARATEAVVLLKGNPTLVTDGGAPWVVRSGGPELATIGTGDVLAGMIGALMARGLHAAEAARSAAFWHGMAGASLREQGTVTADRLALQVGKFAW